MIKEAVRQNKPEIYELWKSAYPTKSKAYLSYYFKHVFDEGKCLYLPQDDRIIASLQMNEHIATFGGNTARLSTQRSYALFDEQRIR